MFLIIPQTLVDLLILVHHKAKLGLRFRNLVKPCLNLLCSLVGIDFPFSSSKTCLRGIHLCFADFGYL